MATITVSLSKALLCIASECFPALVGNATPTGSYELTRLLVQSPGYGGDVLKYTETDEAVFAIHRVWTLNKKEHRLSRLETGSVNQRTGITGGCINVMPDVYDMIDDGDTLDIVP